MAGQRKDFWVYVLIKNKNYERSFAKCEIRYGSVRKENFRIFSFVSLSYEKTEFNTAESLRLSQSRQKMSKDVFNPN